MVILILFVIVSDISVDVILPFLIYPEDIVLNPELIYFSIVILLLLNILHLFLTKSIDKIPSSSNPQLLYIKLFKH